ncbi:MAG: thrombospondin type 3 repeat-containing protein [Gammaproteobacteria bacterium]
MAAFENDALAWQTSASFDGALALELINFESVEGSETVPIQGDEFQSFTGDPLFESIEGIGVFVGNPAPGQIPSPPSGVNMMGPPCTPSCEGIIRLTFSEPVLAIGATFVDVEADFVSTGFSTIVDRTLPEVAFSAPQGQGSFGFLGLVSQKSFTAVDVHFATGANIDGTLIDDLQYVACGTTEDSDNDTVPNSVDNCVFAANVDQRDTDGDHYGNACDADLNNDHVVNVIDLGILRTVFFSNDADADFNGDGVVNIIDLGILRTLFFGRPGPSCSEP